MAEDRPRVGISACLLGEPVRYDAGHKRDRFLVETFGRFVEWVPVCPEVEAGFGTPRAPMRLVRRGPQTLRPGGEAAPVDLVVINSGEIVTSALTTYSDAKMKEIASWRLAGYVLKKDSPSCGASRVRVYAEKGPPMRSGQGLFAERLLARFPELPVEDEGRLADPRLRENFVERVFAYRRLRDLFDGEWRYADLVRFHSVHKLTLMAHDVRAYASLGRLVAEGSRRSRRVVAAEYSAGFMRALSAIATPRRHANVLQHMAGYFKRSLDAADRAEILSLIEDHRLGRVPLIVPITLLKHFIRRQDVPHLRDQVYLDPHPRELSLRNHV